MNKTISRWSCPCDNSNSELHKWSVHCSDLGYIEENNANKFQRLTHSWACAAPSLNGPLVRQPDHEYVLIFAEWLWRQVSYCEGSYGLVDNCVQHRVVGFVHCHNIRADCTPLVSKDSRSLWMSIVLVFGLLTSHILWAMHTLCALTILPLEGIHCGSNRENCNDCLAHDSFRTVS
jgi:hypothetical protein